MNLVEVFTSIQGEGILVGQPQIFLRFAGCNLRCQFCDTPQALTTPQECKITTLNKKLKLSNPVKIYSLIDLIKEDILTYSMICLTGGEPLLEVNPLKELINEVKKKYKAQIYLETNGTLPANLEQVIDMIDIIAMDIKLPSLTGLKSFWEEHKNFLKIANEKQVFVKIVLGHQVVIEEFKRAVFLIKKVNMDIPLVLQPLENSLSLHELLQYQANANKELNKVRIIPQVHKLVGWK
ncbi:MAG: 7-carboxy-7-deazaguanine synthase QueE [bacterium]